MSMIARGSAPGRSPGYGGRMLSGYRVVECAVWVAGPAAAGLLADWGADVIKVEPPAGDPQRKVFNAIGVGRETVPPFELDNRGKRSVVLDLYTDEGRAAMYELLATADVFITNLRPDALARLGLDHETLLERFPRLVYGSITGYGLQGPDRNRPGYDVGAFWARSSMAALHVPPDDMPPAIRSAVGDHVTGMTLAAGLLARLLEREKTGKGGLVATSLLRTGMYCVGWDIGIYLRFGRLQRTRDRTASTTPLVNSYRASDGHGFWLIGLEGDRHWPGLLAALERPDLAGDERFADATSRAKNGPELVAVLDELFGAEPMDHWVARFDEHDVWWAPINTVADVVNDPQAIAAGGFVDMPVVDGEEPYKAVASPLDFSGYTFTARAVPGLGEHSDEVLRQR
jgi:crotonobetainyl-CoA:carnitine CoA-transferase CaiB-like acyl-CoA transferase